MVRYWVIAPYNYDNREAFEKAWDYCRKNGVIGIGWDLLGDLSLASRNEIKVLYLRQAEYRNNPETGNESRGYLSLQRFWHDIEIGDRVIARAGTKRIVGLGTVSTKAFYSLEMGEGLRSGLPMNLHAYFIRVNWQTVDHVFPISVLPRDAVAETKKAHKHWPAFEGVLSQVWSDLA